MVGTTKRLNRMHSAGSCGSKCQRSTLPLSRASLRAPEGDVTLRDVMNVKYFTNPSTAPLSMIGGTCATPWRRGIHSDSSRALLPPSLYERVRDLGFLAKAVMLTVLRATPVDWHDAATCCGVRSYHGLNTPGAAGDKEVSFCCRFGT